MRHSHIHPDVHSLAQNGFANGTKDCQAESHTFATKLIHADAVHASTSSAVIAPITLSTTFKQARPAQPDQFEYSRAGNPNRLALESLLANLELPRDCKTAECLGPYSSEHLPPALAFSSGSATTAVLVQAIAGADGHIISISDVYGGTYRYFTKVAASFGVSVSFLDLSLTCGTKVSHEQVESRLKDAIRPNSKMLWLESPTNPTLRLVDIRRMVEIAHSHGILVVVDNTFASPFYQRPLELGCDVVIHSLTKYINGHSDVVSGGLITNHAELLDKLRFHQNATGSIPSPFDCWLAIRGARTLELRMQRHGLNALKIARWLDRKGKMNGWVKDVIYPGLESSPLWNRQLVWSQLSSEAQTWIESQGYTIESGFPYSGMVSVRVNEQKVDADMFLASLQIFSLAESLGGVESLAELPGKMTHASVSEADRKTLGIDNHLVRLSVGIESDVDLVRDLEQAFKAASIDQTVSR